MNVEKKRKDGWRRTGEVWHDVRCMEEHLRALSIVVCAIGAQKTIEWVDTGVPDEDRDKVEGSVSKSSLFGSPEDGGKLCVPGYPCDGGLNDFNGYVDSLEAYCKLILVELRALIAELGPKDKIRLCGGMFCSCHPGKRKKKG